MNLAKHTLSLLLCFKLLLGPLLWGGATRSYGQEDWLHFQFIAQDRRLSIDTKLWEPRENNQNTFSRVVTAQPVWVNLVSLDPQHPLQPGDRVHVMILNYKHTSGRQIGENTSERIIELDLDYVADEHHGQTVGRFTGQIPPIMVERAYLPGHQIHEEFWQEVVFWINDEIHKDFAHEHNFVFNVAESARCMQLLR